MIAAASSNPNHRFVSGRLTSHSNVRRKNRVKKLEDPKPIEGGSEASGPDAPTTLIEEIPAQQSARVEYSSELIEVEQEETAAVEVEAEPTVTASFHQPVLFFTRAQHEATCQIQPAVAVPDPSVIDLTAYAVDSDESDVGVTELTTVAEADTEAVFEVQSVEAQVEVAVEESIASAPVEVSTPVAEEPAPVRVVKKAEPARRRCGEACGCRPPARCATSGCFAASRPTADRPTTTARRSDQTRCCCSSFGGTNRSPGIAARNY